MTSKRPRIMDTELMRQKGKCCITGKPMHTSGSLNVVWLEQKAAWKYPTIGNVETGEEGYAVAIVHDDAVNPDGTFTGEIQYAVEFQGPEIIYHPITKTNSNEKQTDQVGIRGG